MTSAIEKTKAVHALGRAVTVIDKGTGSLRRNSLLSLPNTLRLPHFKGGLLSCKLGHFAIASSQ
jgi:hypothetical protein